MTARSPTMVTLHDTGLDRPRWPSGKESPRERKIRVRIPLAPGFFRGHNTLSLAFVFGSHGLYSI